MIWDVPVVRNASCTLLGMPESSPGKMPVRNEACGSGARSVCAMTFFARALKAYNHPNGANPVAVAEIGDRWHLDQRQAFHHSRRLIGDTELVGLDTQVRIRVARVRLTDDDAFDDHRLGLIIVSGKGCLVQVRLYRVVAQCTQSCGEREDKNPPRRGRAPPEDNAEKRHARDKTQSEIGQRDTRYEPDANEPGKREGDEWHCHTVILSPFGVGEFQMDNCAILA